jgi:CheY-like chemotaxis protein
MTAPGRILVVEDDESLREALLEVLGDEGHDVRAAAHGAEALETLVAMDDWEPELLVLDLMMPVMDAFEFREHQRQRAVAPAARVLVLSAARDLDGAAERLAADACLAKPFRLDEMLTTVDRLLDDHRAGDAAAR